MHMLDSKIWTDGLFNPRSQHWGTLDGVKQLIVGLDVLVAPKPWQLDDGRVFCTDG
jgi:hypothetical protein